MSFFEKLANIIKRILGISDPQDPPQVKKGGTSSSSHGGIDADTKKILRELQSGPKSAKELSARLGIYKTELNPILYRYQDQLFRKEGENPPIWFAFGHGADEPDEKVEITSIEDREPYDWQIMAFGEWLKSKEVGVIEAVTGTGKTQLGIMALGKVYMEGGKGVVLVPTRELQDQWVAELEARGFTSIGRLGNGFNDSLSGCAVLVAVAASASIYDLGLPKKTKGVLVADEVHRYASETWKNGLEEGFKSRLGLTATFERFDKAHEALLLPYFQKVVFTYGYEEAIQQGIIAEFKLATIGVNFSKRERADYEEATEEMNNAVRHLVNHHGAPDPYAGGSAFSDFMKYVAQLSYDGDRREGMAAGKFLKQFSARRRLLAETRAKYDALEKLVPAIKKSNGTIAFTATIDSAKVAADVLRSKKVSCGLIHSKMDREERRGVLADFKERKLKAIIAPKVLDEGIDVPEADLGIIIAASKERRQMIQRMGRVLRRKQDQRLAKFAILYVKNTGEDPERGGHEAFLDTILPVASNHEDFGPKSSMKKISGFLSV
jgi:RNA polymerase primary sigma factor